MLPITHNEESLKLTADALVDLWKITLKGTATSVFFTVREQVTWLGDTYQQIGCKLENDQMTGDGQEIRPTLTILNPAGIFNTFIQAGTLDLATVVRRRVLRTHLEANLSIYSQRMWYVSNISNLISGQSFTLNLRNMSEGPTFWVPARQYLPPTFPTVSL